jgi:hypothetical protein
VAAVIAEVAIVLGTVGAVTTLAVFAITATRRAGNHQARADSTSVRLENMTARCHDESKRADYEKERANALDDTLAEMALVYAGPIDGSLGRLLQTWARAKLPDGDGARTVSPSSAPAEPGSDDLLPFPQ